MKENEKVTLGFDVDNCLRDFTEGVNQVFAKQFPKFAYCLKDAWCWDWFYYYPWAEIMRELNIQGNKDKFAEDWFVKNGAEVQKIGPAFKGAIETLKQFVEVFDRDDTEVAIVTMQRTPEMEVATEEWIRKQGLENITVKFAKTWEDKWNLCDILIDDSIDVLNTKPDNKVAIKVTCPWNKDINGFVNVNSFDQITPENILDSITLFKLLQL